MAQLMYGKNVVKQILKDGSPVRKIYVAVNDPEIEKLLKHAKAPIERVPRAQLNRIAKTPNHQGIAAEVDDYPTCTLDELIRNKKEDGKGLIILLDELEDPHNLGAILRTADAVGATGVIFKKTHAVGLTPAVAKVSAGAINTVKCAAVTNLSRTIEKLQENGWWIVGADMDGQDYRSLDYAMDTVLVIGNEGKGISRLIREKCDFVVSLPMQGKITSLNASVSAGILMYEIYSKHFPL